MLSLLYLSGISFVAFFVAAGFVKPTPPGGVAWPYFVVMLLIPFATYRHANRLSMAICYGFANGIIFGWPVFVDGRTPLRAESGLESEAELLTKITLFAIATTFACILSHIVGRRQGCCRAKRCS